ncbi:MAG TPA: hypothetical protein VNK82_12685 [Terriglobales bacterium]|nr:hypothetical protein [Terriglobales bacterium]
MSQELTDHIRRLTADLKKVQDEINRAAIGDPAEAVRTQTLDQMLDRTLIAAFKSAVDHTRLVLWAHLEAAGKHTGVDAQDLLLKARMERVTEMLRLLREELRTPPVAATSEARALLNEIAVATGVTVRQV